MELNIGDQVTTAEHVKSLPLWTVLKSKMGAVYVKSDFVLYRVANDYSWVQLLDNMTEQYDDRGILDFIGYGDELFIVSLPNAR